jgi:hypothetical protein
MHDIEYSNPGWRNWQPRLTVNQVSERTCGFESHPRSSGGQAAPSSASIRPQARSALEPGLCRAAIRAAASR